MIRFACPGCGVVYSVADEKAGKTGKCPKCQSNFVIPNADPSAPPPLPGAEPDESLVAADETPPPPPPVEDPNAPVEVAPCPGCQVRLSVEPKDVGQEVECPYCKTLFTAKRVQPKPSSVGTGSRRPKDEDRPSQRRSRRDEEEERPSRRRDRRWDTDDEDDRDDYEPRRRNQKPSEVSAVAGMLLGGGIYALVQAAALVLGSTLICCAWPGTYYALVVGIMMIVRGANMLNNRDESGPPRTLLILQIIMIVNFDIPNLVMGIVGLTLLGNDKVKDYYQRRGFDM